MPLRAHFRRHEDAYETNPPGDDGPQQLAVRLVALPQNRLHIGTLRPLLQGCTPGALASALRRLEHRGAAPRGFEVFSQLRALPRSDPLSALCDTTTYSAAMSLCTGPKGHKVALRMLDDMKREGIERSSYTYTSLMKTCLNAGKPEMAIDMFRAMADEGLQPTLVTYHGLMDAYGRLGAWQNVLELLDLTTEQGMDPDVRTFNVAIAACARCDRIMECTQILERLVDLGVKPSLSTYTSLVALYCRMGQVEGAGRLLETMERAGVKPNTTTYTTLMNNCAEAGDVAGAMELFLKTQELKCKPFVTTYNTLLKACAAKGDWRTAMTLWQHMLTSSCRPDGVSFGSFLATLHGSARWAVLGHVFAHNAPSSVQTCRIVVEKVVDALWCTGSWDARCSALQLCNRSDVLALELDPAAPPGAWVWQTKVHLPGAALCLLLTWIKRVHGASAAGSRAARQHPSPFAALNGLLLKRDAAPLGALYAPPGPLGGVYDDPQMAVRDGAMCAALRPPPMALLSSIAPPGLSSMADLDSALPNLAAVLGGGGPGVHYTTWPPRDPNPPPVPAAVPAAALSYPWPDATDGGALRVGRAPPAHAALLAPSHVYTLHDAAGQRAALGSAWGPPPSTVELKFKTMRVGDQPADVIEEQLRAEIARMGAPLRLGSQGQLVCVTGAYDEVCAWLEEPSTWEALELLSAAAAGPPQPALGAPAPAAFVAASAAAARAVSARQQDLQAAFRAAAAAEASHFPLALPPHHLTRVHEIAHAMAALRLRLSDQAPDVFWTWQTQLLVCAYSRRDCPPPGPAAVHPPADPPPFEATPPPAQDRAAAPPPRHSGPFAIPQLPMMMRAVDGAPSPSSVSSSSLGYVLETSLSTRSASPGRYTLAASQYTHSGSFPLSHVGVRFPQRPPPATAERSASFPSFLAPQLRGPAAHRPDNAAARGFDVEAAPPDGPPGAQQSAALGPSGSFDAALESWRDQPGPGSGPPFSRLALPSMDEEQPGFDPWLSMVSSMGLDLAAVGANAAPRGDGLCVSGEDAPPPAPSQVLGAKSVAAATPHLAHLIKRGQAPFPHVYPQHPQPPQPPSQHAPGLLQLASSFAPAPPPRRSTEQSAFVAGPESSVRALTSAAGAPTASGGCEGGEAWSGRKAAEPEVLPISQICVLLGDPTATSQWREAKQTSQSSKELNVILSTLSRVGDQAISFSLWSMAELYLSALYSAVETHEHAVLRDFVRQHMAAVGTSPQLLLERPSLLAAALLTCSRAALLLYPEWPQELVAMTGYALTLPPPRQPAHVQPTPLLALCVKVSQELGLAPFSPSLYEHSRALGGDRIARSESAPPSQLPTRYLARVLQRLLRHHR